MRFFLAGIMQGSQQDKGLHDQGYRARLKQALQRHFPDAVFMSDTPSVRERILD